MVILTLIKKFGILFVGIQYSLLKDFDFYSEELEMGATFSVGTISSEKSFLPRSVKVGLKTEMFGKVYNIFELWTRSQGVQGVLQHFITDKKLLHRLLSGEKVDGESLKKIYESILSLPEKIKQKSISRDQDASEPNHEPESLESSIALRVFGYDVAHWLFDGEKLKSILKEANNYKISETIEKLRSSSGLEMTVQKSIGLTGSFVVPTITGIPLTLNTTMLFHSEIDGAVKVSISKDALTEFFSKPYSVPSFTSSIAIKPKFSFNGHVMLGAHVGPIKTLTGIDVTCDSAWSQNHFTASVSYDSKSAKSEMKFSLPESHTVLHNSSIVPVNIFEIVPAPKSKENIFEVKVVSNNLTSTVNESVIKSKVI